MDTEYTLYLQQQELNQHQETGASSQSTIFPSSHLQRFQGSETALSSYTCTYSVPLTCVSAQALETDMWEGSRVGPAHVAPVAMLETERNRFIPAQPTPMSL